MWNNLRAATGQIVTRGRGRVGIRVGGGELNAWVKGIYTKILHQLRWTPPPLIPFKPSTIRFQYGHKIIELVHKLYVLILHVVLGNFFSILMTFKIYFASPLSQPSLRSPPTQPQKEKKRKTIFHLTSIACKRIFFI